MAQQVLDHRHHRLIVSDVRAVLRLCNELHAASHEGNARKRKLLEGVCKLTGADHASAVVASLERKSGHAHVVSVVHTAARQQQRAKDALHDGQACGIPWDSCRGGRRGRRRKDGRAALATRAGVTTVTSVAGAGGEHCAHAFLPLVDGDVVACLTVRRKKGRSRFTQRERAIACVLHAEVGWIYRPDMMLVAPETRSLSPRERETLHHLLVGEGEKQIASEMGLSYNTIHHYVKAVYRHFRVSSRSELLARWVGR